MLRLTWEEYALAIAEVAKLRSEDPYEQVGATTLRHNNTVASLGYNGSAPGIELDWPDRDKRRQFVIHAEVNCLNYVQPGECRLLACTMLPCTNCLKEIAIKGIKHVVFRKYYETDPKVAEESFETAKLFGIRLQQI